MLQTDAFWMTQRGKPFPQVAAAVEEATAVVTEKERKIKDLGVPYAYISTHIYISMYKHCPQVTVHKYFKILSRYTHTFFLSYPLNEL